MQKELEPGDIIEIRKFKWDFGRPTEIWVKVSFLKMLEGRPVVIHDNCFKEHVHDWRHCAQNA